MRAEALAALKEVGVPVRARLSDIMPVSVPVHGTRRRAVLLASADGASIDAALAPLVNAEIRIGSLLTPAAALLSLARLRRTIDHSEASTGDEAYVVLEENAGCAALIRGGSLLASRALPWGYVDESRGRRVLRPRQEIATRLAGDLVEFASTARLDPAGLAQISVCGALPELRSMAAQLVERLDVEVEPHDTLFGIDPTGGAAGTDLFSERIAELRLAWAAAADSRPALDLLRARRSREVRRSLSRAAVVAGVAVGLGVGWLVQTRWGPVMPRPRAAAPPPPTFEQAPAFSPERPAPPPLAATPGTIPSDSVAAPEAAIAASTPVPVAPPPLEEVQAPAPVPPLEPPQALKRADPAPTVPPVNRVPAARPAPPPEVPLPFEASLATILFGPERRLAIVDGRIVGEGDEIRGARVVEITQNAVLLRDAQGRLRRLTGGAR
jgi:hypothetical protein